MTCARLSEIDAVADARDTSEEQPGMNTSGRYMYFVLGTLLYSVVHAMYRDIQIHVL